MLSWLFKKRVSTPERTGADLMEEAHRRYQEGAPQAAAELCRRVLDQVPSQPAALYLLGVMASTEGRAEEAAACLAGACEAEPSNAEFRFALGCVQSELGAHREAESSYRAAIGLEPAHASARVNLGCLLQARGEAVEGAEGDRLLEEAEQHFAMATRAAPDQADAWMNLGFALARQRRLAEAGQAYDRALDLQPGNALARFNRAVALLARKQYRDGWRDYEARWSASGFTPHAFACPRWTGGDLAGRRLLLFTEQGFGDAIQFVRYSASLAAQGARVEIACPAPLVRLFAGARGVSAVHDIATATPDCDLHAPLLSVPYLAGIDAVPTAGAYIAPDPGLAARWSERLQGSRAFRVGIAWASRSAFPGAAQKSVPTGRLAAFRDLEGVEFVSLQLPAEAGVPVPLRDHAGLLTDFAETAGLIAALDLVLSVDTAVAHLAGSMAAPLWVMLPYSADWRWGADGERCDWYPGARLFRQRRRGDWSGVISSVRDALQAEARRATSRT